MSKLYRLKYNALVSAERRRDKLAFHIEVTYFDLLESKGADYAEKMHDIWLAEQEKIDEALAHVRGTCYEPKVEGKYWGVINACINKVSAL